MQRLLRAYEAVLPRHGVRPQDDIYYYRFLLKLSLDPDPDWWAKFDREREASVPGAHRCGSSFEAAHASQRLY